MKFISCSILLFLTILASTFQIPLANAKSCGSLPEETKTYFDGNLTLRIKKEDCYWRAAFVNNTPNGYRCYLNDSTVKIHPNNTLGWRPIDSSSEIKYQCQLWSSPQRIVANTSDYKAVEAIRKGIRSFQFTSKAKFAQFCDILNEKNTNTERVILKKKQASDWVNVASISENYKTQCKFTAYPEFPSAQSCKESFETKNYKRAHYHCSDIAQNKFLSIGWAGLYMGIMYDNGFGVTKDFSKAIYWYTQAAEFNQVDAQYNLGVMHDFGIGTKKNKKQAAYWYKKAAKQNHPKAQTNLGTMYYYGNGVNKDFKKMIYWYTKAAKLGHAKAQFNLGGMYRQGEGVPVSLVDAYAWVNLAAAQGMDNAIKFRKFLDSKLSPSQRETAQALSSKYYKLYANKGDE